MPSLAIRTAKPARTRHVDLSNFAYPMIAVGTAAAVGVRMVDLAGRALDPVGGMALVAQADPGLNLTGLGGILLGLGGIALKGYELYIKHNVETAGLSEEVAHLRDQVTVLAKEVHKLRTHIVNEWKQYDRPLPPDFWQSGEHEGPKP